MLFRSRIDLEHRLKTARSREAALLKQIRKLEGDSATPKTRWKEAVNKINNPKFYDVVKDWTKRCSSDGLWEDLRNGNKPWLTKADFKKKLSEEMLKGCLGDKLLPNLSKEERSAFLGELFDEMDADPKDPARLTKEEFKQYILKRTKKKQVSRETPEEKEKRENQERKEKANVKVLKRGGYKGSLKNGRLKKGRQRNSDDINLVF